MLISLTKILLFLVIVAALALGVAYLIDGQNLILGNVQAIVAGTEYTLTPLQAVLALFFFSILVWIGLKIFGLLIAVLKFINGDETAVTRYFFRNRERKGYQALSEGLLALASGEGTLALSKAVKAERFLNRPALTNVLAAQAAELTGDQRKAEEIYKQLIQEPSTRFLGIRGIMKQKLADGKTDIALKLAEKAFALKPKHVETQDTLLALQAQAKDWKGARHTLGAKLKHGALPRDVHKRRDAVLALSQAKDVLGQGQSIEAREAAIEANRLSPDLVPAAVMAARSYLDAEKPKYALRVIKKAWQAQPHPDLASIFAELAPEETPQQRLKRFSVLEKLAPAHRETRLALAELHLYAEDFPGAKRAVGALLETEADARVLTIMAAIERGQGSPDKVIRGWLTKALAAQRGPRWVCDSCHGVNTVWSATCQHCEAFDTLSWRPAPTEELSTSNGLDMVQLLMAEASPEAAEGDKLDPEKALDVDTAPPESAAIALSEQAQEKSVN